MFERFAQSARAVIDDARYEAERRGDRRIGSDHLLLALVADDAMAQLVGVDAAAAREAADRLDRAALVAIGLTLGEFRPSGRSALSRQVPLNSGAKRAIQQALANAAAEKARAITTRHLLLALLDRQEPDPAAVLLAELSVDRRLLRERLAAAA